MDARAVAAAVATFLVASPAAGAAAGGEVVVRLATDPTPPGVMWTYAGLGTPFELGSPSTAKTVSGLADGTYTVAETAAAGRPTTLTALACNDPSGGTTVDRADATAHVDLTAGETVTCTFTHRALGSRPGARAAQLARRYAPILRLQGGERYRPLRLEDYVATADLRDGRPPHGTLAVARPTLFSLATTAAPTYLDVRTAEPKVRSTGYPAIEQELESTRPRPTVYFHLAYQPSAGRIAVEYWFLYLYNDFYDAHEADWEGVTVFLENGAPIGATFSQHQGRTWIGWASIAKSSGHPIVYVARGSHAEYPGAGRYSIRVCWTTSGGRRCAPSPRVDEARGTGATVGPTGYDLSSLGGVGFTGGFGSGTYILGIGPTRDRVTDPRRRAEYSFPFDEVRP